MTSLSRILQVIKNGSFMTIFKTKGSGLRRMNLNNLLQRWSFMEEKLWCVYGRITASIHIEFLNYYQTLNADL